MKKRLGRILSVIAILLMMGMTVCAADADNIKKNNVFQTNSDVELHEEPDTASGVAATLPAGTPVIVKEDAQDGWCMVAYQEQTGYVQISFLSVLGSQVTSNAPDDSDSTENENETDAGEAEAGNVNAVDDELKRIKEENILMYEEAEAAKEQAASEKRWGIVIAVLVIAIFAVGIVTTVRNNKGKKK